LTQLTSLQALLVGHSAHGTSTVVFSRDLSIGSTGTDVKALQVYLNTHGFVVNSNPSGPDSPGHETTRFGALTKKALIKYQKNAGIRPTGYFGPITRKRVNGSG
jgi:peptidoglycan hydrolase-like protein with peptidoglycan-binding domain